MNYSQLLSDCWKYGASYLPLCGFPTWAASVLPSLGGCEIIPMGTRRFRVLQKLGEGGYAVVYLVSELATTEHPRSDPELRALKRILVHSNEHLDAVQQEMLVHSAVQHHPNILPLLDYSCTESADAGGISLPASTLINPPVQLSPPITTVTSGGGGDVGFIIPNAAATNLGPGQNRVACFLFPVFRDGTLASELERMAGRGQMLPTSDVLSIFGQLARAAAHIHAHGYAHRDIKPLNVLIDTNSDSAASWQRGHQHQQKHQHQQQPGGWLMGLQRWPGGARTGGGGSNTLEDVEAGVALTTGSSSWKGTDAGPRYHSVLMDFGSARSRSVHVASRSQALQIQEDAEAHCSAPYRAPELFDVPSPGPLDFATADVWALGASLFHIMYGEPPFARAMNAAGGSLALAVINCAIGWPRAPGPAYPPELHELVQSAMAPEPSSRPSARQLAELAAALTLKGLRDPMPQTLQQQQQAGAATALPKR